MGTFPLRSGGTLPRVTEHHPRTIIEPFRIKSVEAVKFTTRAEREAALVAAGYNVFDCAPTTC